MRISKLRLFSVIFIKLMAVLHCKDQNYTIAYNVHIPDTSMFD